MRSAIAPDLEPSATAIVHVEGFPPPWKSVIVHRLQDGEVVAYWNVCRHLPVPLAPEAGELGRGAWTCGVHGAVYEPASGACISGPCAGLNLYPLPTRPTPSGLHILCTIPG